MKNYTLYLNQLKLNQKLYELSMSKEKKEEINKLKQTEDFKIIIKEITLLIQKIKNSAKNIYYDDIRYQIIDDAIEIHYDANTSALLNTLKEVLFGLYENDEIMEKTFDGGYREMFLEISIDKNLNKIDILNGLPIFMKNIGLGKKIYKKLIKDFNYMSSFQGYEPSIDSNMVWDTIFDDKEIYSFSNDDNFISFWNDYSFDKIIEILKTFYKQSGNQIYDDDFLSKYKLTDIKLSNLIKSI